MALNITFTIGAETAENQFEITATDGRFVMLDNMNLSDLMVPVIGNEMRRFLRTLSRLSAQTLDVPSRDVPTVRSRMQAKTVSLDI